VNETPGTIPVHPEPGGDYKLYAVTWLSLNGEQYTRLLGAESADDAAKLILYGVDHTIRRFTHHASIDVRECGAVHTYEPQVVLGSANSSD
jgi:hypothetical protein